MNNHFLFRYIAAYLLNIVPKLYENTLTAVFLQFGSQKLKMNSIESFCQVNKKWRSYFFSVAHSAPKFTRLN